MATNVLLISTLLAIVMTTAGVGFVNMPAVQATAQTDQEEDVPGFVANLVGESEVPPVDTSATGTAELQLSEDGQTISYSIDANDLEGALMAHIHQGGENENGDILVWLFNSTEPTGEISGQLDNNGFTAGSFEGPLQGQNMSSLVDLINSGQTYVNVHTEENPDGEIRGTIEPVVGEDSNDDDENSNDNDENSNDNDDNDNN